MGNGRYTNRDLLVLNFSLVLLVFFNFVLCTTQAGLSVEKECGDHKCEAHEYCSPIDHTCQPCNRICNKSNNNFDSNRCESDCQDYLHDIRYEKDKSKELEELQKDVTILTVIVVICLIVIILVGCALVAFTVYFWKILHNNKSHESNNSSKDKKGKISSSQKGMELPTVYNNKYAPSSREVSPSPPSVSPTHSDERSPSKSEQLNNSINSSASMPATVSTLVLNGSSSDTLQNTFSSSNNSNHNNNNNQQRFRREPSESTLPDYIPNGNPAGVGLRDSSSLHYSHHV